MREDCSGKSGVSGMTVWQWQMVYMAHGSRGPLKRF